MAILAANSLLEVNSVDSTKFPIKVATDHRHLEDAAGRSFTIQGDTAWSLIVGLQMENATRYLEDRKAKGFNSIVVNLIEHQFNGPVNRYGDEPFSTPGDFSTPKEAYFKHAEWVIEEAGRYGIQVFLAPIYLGYPGTNDGWIKEAVSNGPDKCRDWGRFVGKHFGRFDNIVWLMGGDKNPGEALACVDAVANGIREFDPRHLMTAHTLEENSPVEQYGAGGGWLTLNSTYTYGVVSFKLLSDYNRQPAMPCFLIESVYEGEWNSTSFQIRRQAYWAMLSGAAGQFLGNNPIWLFNPGWEKALDSTASHDMGRLFQFFGDHTRTHLIPDQKHEFVLDGLGEYRGQNYLAAAYSPNRQTLVAYIPSVRNFTVDLSRFPQERIHAEWFDPRTGKYRSILEVRSKVKRQFRSPTDEDWVLVVGQL